MVKDVGSSVELRRLRRLEAPEARGALQMLGTGSRSLLM